MGSATTINGADVEDLALMVARRIMATNSMIFPFAELTGFVTELLRNFDQPSSKLVCAGHATPDIAIAAERAAVELVEVISESPFTGHIEAVLSRIRNDNDIVYVANPNKITGANYSVSDLKLLTGAVPRGILIVDEHFYDFFGITAFPILNAFPDVLILRSFTASFGVYSSDVGFAISSPDMIRTLRDSIQVKGISPTVRKTILATLMNDEAMAFRLKEIHDESLRISTTLGRLGVQCRITATDFMLMRVASPKDVGNFLASYKVSVENLDGYPLMNNYVKYRVESPYSNERFLNAFAKMPPEYYKMKSFDRRAVTIHRRGRKSADATGPDVVGEMMAGGVKVRSKQDLLIDE